jgi:hypothetical protein
MAALIKFVSLSEAAERLRLESKYLLRLINNGKIEAASINGETVVSERDIIKMTPTPRDDLAEYKKFKKLKGIPIWLSEAARKYELSHKTIQQWIVKGYIARLGVDGNKILLNEQDVAYCKFIYERMGDSTKGKRIFNDDGTPFAPLPPRRKPPRQRQPHSKAPVTANM